MVQPLLSATHKWFAKLQSRSPMGMKVRLIYPLLVMLIALTTQHPQQEMVSAEDSGSMKWPNKTPTPPLKTPMFPNTLLRPVATVFLLLKAPLTFRRCPVPATAPLVPGRPWQHRLETALWMETARTGPLPNLEALRQPPTNPNPPRNPPPLRPGPKLLSDTSSPLHILSRHLLPVLTWPLPPRLTIPPTSLMVGPLPWEHPLCPGPMIILVTLNEAGWRSMPRVPPPRFVPRPMIPPLHLSEDMISWASFPLPRRSKVLLLLATVLTAEPLNTMDMQDRGLLSMELSMTLDVEATSRVHRMETLAMNRNRISKATQ